MQNDLVSVIMPTFDSGLKLADSIDSILNQTYRNLELIITDDDSTDAETLGILKSYCEKDERVSVLFLEVNKGPGYARDRSIERARGRYIAFCDSDDKWYPEKLERQIAFMNEKQCVLSYTSYIIIDNDDCETGIVIAPPSMSFQKLKLDNQIGCLTAIYDSKLLGRKYFMPFIRKRQDWGLFLTILRDTGQKAYAIQDPLDYYRDTKGSVSSNKLGLIKYNIRIYEKVLGFSHLKAVLYFYFLFTPAHIRKLIKKYWDSFLYVHGKGPYANKR